MSDTEHHKGKLIPISSIEEWLTVNNLHARLEELGGELCELLSTDYDGYNDNPHFMEHNGKIYKIVDTELEDYNFNNASINDDGSIDYHVMFYNGGCGLEECITDSINKID